MNNIVFMKSDRAQRSTGGDRASNINDNTHIHANVRTSFNEQETIPEIHSSAYIHPLAAVIMTSIFPHHQVYFLTNFKGHLYKFNQRIINMLERGLNRTAIQNPRLARRLCQLIPAHCPFERNVQIFRRTFHIPSLC